MTLEISRTKFVDRRARVGFLDVDWPAHGRLLCATLICVAASMMLVFSPLLLDALRRDDALGQDHTQATEHDIAKIGSADQTGMFLGAIVGLALLPKTNRRRFALAGLGLLVAGDMGSLLVGAIGAPLYSCRVLAGTGAGMAMGAAYAAFGDAVRPERYFALFGLLQTAVGSTLILGLTKLETRFGYRAWYAASLVLALLALGVGRYLDAGARDRRAAGTAAATLPPTSWRAGLLVAITFFSLSLSASALWSNAESIGRSFGIGRADAAAALAASLIAGVAGSLGVLFTPHRWGRTVPTLIVSAAYLVGVALLLTPQSVAGFLCALAAFQVGINLGFYGVGAIAESDPSGRLAVIYLLAMKAGFAAGPLWAARFIRGTDFHLVVVSVFACALVLCGLLLTTLSVFRSERKSI